MLRLQGVLRVPPQSSGLSFYDFIAKRNRIIRADPETNLMVGVKK